MATNLEQTKGKVKLEGKVVGIDNQNSYREGLTKKDAEYKSLSFFVQTSETNRIKVEVFGMVKENVIAYSNKDKKSKKIAWDKRYDNHGDYKIMGTNLSIEKDAKGKLVKKIFAEFDAIEYMQEHLNDGDFVRVMADFDFQEFENSEGEVKQSTKFVINSITMINEIDFEDENFKEVATFEQEIVISDLMADTETKKLLVGAKIIGYKGDSHVETLFVVDAEKYPKLANNMTKRMKFGDFIKVYGKVVNMTVETNEVVADDDDWGGDDEVKSEFNFIKEYISEIQITAVDSATYEAKKYNEEDFINEDEDNFNGKGKVDEGDSFEDDEDEDDDDLPF